MGDNYLWDGSGEPDPEVGRLERLLTQFRSERPAPEFPERELSERGWRRRWAELWRPYAVVRLAAVAVFRDFSGTRRKASNQHARERNGHDDR